MAPRPCGIFPSLDDSPEKSVDNLAPDFENFSNYAGVDIDDVAVVDIQSHILKEHLKSFDSIVELRAFLNGQEPT